MLYSPSLFPWSYPWHGLIMYTGYFSYISFIFFSKIKLTKEIPVFLTPAICFLILFSLFLLQVLSKATNHLLTVLDNDLIFFDISQPFNISDYPLLNNLPVLTWEAPCYLLSFSRSHCPTLLVSFTSFLCPQKGRHTHRMVINLLIYIFSHMVIYSHPSVLISPNG